jgi:predicted peptidase
MVGWDSVNVNGSPESNDSESGRDVVVSTGLDWGCGYEYEVKVPVGYDPEVSYPVMMFLHGGVTSSGLEFYFRFLTGNFYMPADDKYIIVQPAKKEVDWDPKKALDVLEDVKSNMNVNDSRVYLTGLSMGGRGTFILAAALPDYFAALMPLSPHHDPFPYTELAEDVAHIPIWMSHGDSDNTSSYEMAAEMATLLEELDADIEFRTVVGGEHGGWFGIYIDSEAMGWVLSKTRVMPESSSS